jgi:ferredoxin
MKVIVSTDKCIASGMCVLACPQVFTQSDVDGTVEVLDVHPPLTLIDKVKGAVEGCPAQVFRIEDEDNATEVVFEKE